MDTAHRSVPPLARRPEARSATALKEEIADSWRLLFGCLGATGAASALFYLLTVLAG